MDWQTGRLERDITRLTVAAVAVVFTAGAAAGAAAHRRWVRRRA